MRHGEDRRGPGPQGGAVRSLSEVARIVGMSHEGVAVAERRVLRRLRAALASDPLIRDYCFDLGLDPCAAHEEDD